MIKEIVIKSQYNSLFIQLYGDVKIQILVSTTESMLEKIIINFDIG